jgi:hypothetical protein
LQNELLALLRFGLSSGFVQFGCGQVAGRPDSYSGSEERKGAPQGFTTIRSHGSLLLQILVLVLTGGESVLRRRDY